MYQDIVLYLLLYITLILTLTFNTVIVIRTPLYFYALSNALYYKSFSVLLALSFDASINVFVGLIITHSVTLSMFTHNLDLMHVTCFVKLAAPLVADETHFTAEFCCRVNKQLNASNAKAISSDDSAFTATNAGVR